VRGTGIVDAAGADCSSCQSNMIAANGTHVLTYLGSDLPVDPSTGTGGIAGVWKVVVMAENDPTSAEVGCPAPSIRFGITFGEVFEMPEITSFSSAFRLRLPESEEFENVEVTFTAAELARLKQFVACSTDLLRTSIVQRGFPTSIVVNFAEGQLATEWSRPTDDEMAAYLHRYRPFGLQRESTYFYKIVNLLSKNVENDLFRSSLHRLGDMFSGKHMQENKIKIESNDVVLNSDDFFMDWLNAYEYHRAPDAIQRVDALHTIIPLGFTEAFMMTLMSEKTGAISRVAHYVKAFVEV
jgi:hypothetical protein